jgi:Dolichyl-phosphate-mannose-protein mannosyltransferase
MTITSQETAPFSHWLRRLWPLYCLLAALVTFGYALFDPYQVDGDAVAYMDIGDLMRSHQWSAVINGYWNPLYPAALSIGHTLFHSNRYNELHAYYMVNFGIFLLEMLAIIAFTGALAQLRDLRETASPEKSRHGFLLDRYALGYLGIGIIIVSTQRELSLGKVRPDALLLAFLLLAIAALMKYLATNHLRYAALMGAALGLAYLTKSFAFVFTLLCVLALIAFRVFWQRQSIGRVAVSAALVILCFSVVAGPYIAALSKQKGHFDFGDSGSLNYIWFVSGTEKMHLQPDMTSSFGAAEVHLKHPETRLLKSPPTYSFKPFPYGTYPVWFDASYFNDHIKAHMDLHLQIVVIGQSIVRLLRYMSNHPEVWIILLILFFAGGRLYPNWRFTENAFWLVPTLLGVAALGVYIIVNVEDRYLTAAFFTLLIPIFAAMRVSSAQALPARTGAAVAVSLFALLAVGESARIIGEFRREQITAQYPSGWYNRDVFNAAHALNDLGVGPGDTVACIGTRACVYDHYWARLAGVRILSEIYEPNTPLYPYLAAIPNRSEVYGVVRHDGGKVLVGYFDVGTTPTPDGWRELNGTPYYVLPLNLPPTPEAEKTTP